MRNEPADGYAGEVVEQWQHGVEHGPANIFEVNVDAFGACCFQSGRQTWLVMIQAFIERKLVLDEAALLRPAGNTNDPATFHAADLAYYGTDGARCGRHDQ